MVDEALAFSYPKVTETNRERAGDIKWWSKISCWQTCISLFIFLNGSMLDFLLYIADVNI